MTATTTTTTAATAVSLGQLAFGTQQDCEQALRTTLRGSDAQARTRFGVTYDQEEMIAAVVGSMTGPIGPLFRGVWDRYDRVQRARAATAASPALEQWVPFTSLPLSLTKRFDLVVDGVGADTIVMNFVLAVQVDLEAARVHVLGGRVAGFNPGQAATSGSFGYNWPGTTDKRTIATWKPHPVALPGYIEVAA